MDPVWIPRLNTALWTRSRTDAAPDASICNPVSLLLFCSISNHIRFPKNRMHTKMKIFDPGVFDFKHNSNLSGVSRIDIGKIRLLPENRIDPLLLALFRHRPYLCGEPDHLFVLRIAKDLHSAVFQQFFAEVLSSCRKEIKSVRLIMNGTDISDLRISFPIHGSKCQHSDIF